MVEASYGLQLTRGYRRATYVLFSSYCLRVSSLFLVETHEASTEGQFRHRRQSPCDVNLGGRCGVNVAPLHGATHYDWGFLRSKTDRRVYIETDRLGKYLYIHTWYIIFCGSFIFMRKHNERVDVQFWPPRQPRVLSTLVAAMLPTLRTPCMRNPLYLGLVAV